MADAESIIRAVIYGWKPFEWLDDDPADPELHRECAAIAKQLDRIRSEKDAAHVVSRVFTSSFDNRFTVDRCESVGRELFRQLSAAGVAE